ncbi:monovalent cation/H+ antiporter subunit D family protein [Corynebacterium lubricantis]|uniref:monovalent cation/H+ antiporter subunit D family protein n=1 Tax=Corynebacterium lubricantis TaxID=541095 RepID=UPI00035F9F66|nr:monovalent cation/H+ antiporter subunit D family protein [Corynebacterium lubricantis]
MTLNYDLVSTYLTLYVAIPLVVAGFLVMVRRPLWLQYVGMFATLIAAQIASGFLIYGTLDGTTFASGTGNWPFGIAIPFAADMFAALMLTTTGILALASAWFAVASGYAKEPYFAPLILVLMTGVNGAILTADIFNFFVFLEVMLLPSYGLYVLSIHRRGGNIMVGGVRLFVTANLLASTMFLAGVAMVYGTAGTVNLAQLDGAASADPAVAIATSIVMLSMLTKASVVPVHSWLARSYPYTSPAVTALFSGLHTKVAVYILYRIYAVMFDGDERFLWILVLLFSLTMLIGVLGAVGEKDARSILTFHMVSQLGYILLGLGIFTQLGITAGIFYLVHHMIVKASLFMSTGAVEVRYGTGKIGDLAGIARREPWMAVAFFAAALSLAGIPPFSGFVAKFSLMLAAWDAGEIYALVIMVIVSLITLLSMLKIWNGMFWGHASKARVPVDTAAPARVGFWLGAPAVILAVLTLAIGLGAQVLMGWAEVATENLMDTTSYVSAVMNA